MNQGRVSAVVLAAGILMVFASGIALQMFIQESATFALTLSVTIGLTGISALRSIYRTANGWSWNVTPQITFKLPQGSWVVMGMFLDRGSSIDDDQPFVYLTICRRENTGASFSRGWGYSTLELTPQILQWEDYQRLLRLEKPLRIYIAEERIGFEWPKKSGLHNMLT